MSALTGAVAYVLALTCGATIPSQAAATAQGPHLLQSCPADSGPGPDACDAPGSTESATTIHHDAAIRQALRVIDQPLNAIKIVDVAQVRAIYARAGVGEPLAGLHAFRITNDPFIYVNTSSRVYRSAAVYPSALSMLRLAAILVHEHVHGTDTEFAACRLQADFFRSRLRTLPKGQQEAARLDLETLDATARALARVTKR